MRARQVLVPANPHAGPGAPATMGGWATSVSVGRDWGMSGNDQRPVRLRSNGHVVRNE